MIKKIRETISGTEYWDSSSKKTLFVAKGEKPEFDLSPDNNVGQVQGKEINDDDKNQNEKSNTGFEDMTIADLKKYAVENGIDIPKDAKKKADIIELLL